MTNRDESPATTFSPIRWGESGLELLDQTRLPREETWLVCREPEDVAGAIRRLSVRGAPAIGVTAAYGLVVGLQSGSQKEGLRERFDETWELLAATRPTAVNLRWALDQGRQVFEQHAGEGREAVTAALLEWAHGLHAADDIEANASAGRSRRRPCSPRVIGS